MADSRKRKDGSKAAVPAREREPETTQDWMRLLSRITARVLNNEMDTRPANTAINASRAWTGQVNMVIRALKAAVPNEVRAALALPPAAGE